MRTPSFTIHHAAVLALAILLSTILTTVAGAQSQEPKPTLPATPITDTEIPAVDSALSGVSGSSWQGPNSGVSLTWDPSVWSVEGEFIDEGYDGLQIGTPLSTVYLEVYDDFGGDAAACFADAERELGEREGVSEVIALTGRPLPGAEDVRGSAGLFGLTVTLPDGTIYRGVEYAECRTVVPGETVLELTWQAVTLAFNEDYANVDELLGAIDMPDVSAPAATPMVPRATPVA